ncbi:MAG TPA: helix-turn-helix domain-containing protein [Vicinamibacterales bacterium]
MDEEFLGRRLRSERERRQITLESIAVNTKINISLLRDLERDDVSRWPTGIFRRAFIRSYAEAIGLDADEIANEFLDRHPDVEQLAAIAALAAKGERPKPRQKPVLRLTLADTPKPFSGGQFLKRAGARVKAAGWDCAATLTLGLIAFLVLGSFWTPFAVVTLCYYAGGILILGNSPGVCLFAPKPHDDTPQTPSALDDESLDGLQTNAATPRNWVIG